MGNAKGQKQKFKYQLLCIDPHAELPGTISIQLKSSPCIRKRLPQLAPQAICRDRTRAPHLTGNQ